MFFIDVLKTSCLKHTNPDWDSFKFKMTLFHIEVFEVALVAEVLQTERSDGHFYFFIFESNIN